jgi:hypothetical protein
LKTLNNKSYGQTLLKIFRTYYSIDGVISDDVVVFRLGPIREGVDDIWLFMVKLEQLKRTV